MKVRFAVAAAILALGVSAFTPTPTAAGPPSGTLRCLLGCEGGLCKSIALPFGDGSSYPTVGDAAKACRITFGGHPVRVRVNR